MSARDDADASTRVVEDIAPHGVDGRDVHPHFVRVIAPGAPDVPVDGLALWAATTTREMDVHAGFLGRFDLDRAAEVEVQLLAVDVYRAWLDGDRLADGPARFPVGAPTCEVVRRSLPAGEHLLAVHVHGFGVTTRMLARIEPFVWARVLLDGEPVSLDWRAAQLDGYWDTKVRVSELLGWIEWSDTRVDGQWWTGEAGTRGWEPPARRAPGLGPIAATRAPVPVREAPMALLAEGRYRERRALMSFPGYELDNPTIQFATTDLDPPAGERADGIWRRYDLGRVRSGTVRLSLDGRAGTEVLIGCAERLFADRLIPFVGLSAGPTCFVSRFVLRGGLQVIEPLCVNGAGYVEVRIGDDGETRLLEASFAEREGLGDPIGTFSCDDEQLERIWAVGIETLRAAAGDALIDSIRERAQWTGDALTVGLEVAAVGWSDLRMLRQALLHPAECANAEGLVGGCTPGDVIYLSTFAAYWVSAGVRYAELTGDMALLRELLPAARANVAALRRRTASDGVLLGAPWPFVDWGHTVIPGRPDPAVLAILLAAARDLRRWEELLGEDATGAEDFAEQLAGLVRASLPGKDDEAAWSEFGYHATIWALRCELVPAQRRPAALASLRAHMLRCFPNDLDAPRLRDPGSRDARVITPFYGHFALGVLLDAGDVDFVIDQWRACWGWMLDQGARTWWEVFDEGWSHGHFWSGCPTWQMSRHLLGLRPRWDRGPGEVDVELRCGGLQRASGTVPLPGGQAEVSWERRGEDIAWEVQATVPLKLTLDGDRHDVRPGARLELML